MPGAEVPRGGDALGRWLEQRHAGIAEDRQWWSRLPGPIVHDEHLHPHPELGEGRSDRSGHHSPPVARGDYHRDVRGLHCAWALSTMTISECPGGQAEKVAQEPDPKQPLSRRRSWRARCPASRSARSPSTTCRC